MRTPYFSELQTAVGLLTRLPVGAWRAEPKDCVWAFPVVGIGVGAVGAAVYAVAPAPLAAILALAATILLTGGLHEDGLADTCDGLGGGATADRKLAIMRDSRIGSYGALALILSLALRTAALGALGHPARALVVAAILGRAAMLVLLLVSNPARPDGLAAALGIRHGVRGAAGLGIAVLATLLLLPARGALPAIGAAALAALLLAAIARRQIGGHTGDVLGAAEMLGECAVLIALVSTG